MMEPRITKFKSKNLVPRNIETVGELRYIAVPKVEDKNILKYLPYYIIKYGDKGADLIISNVPGLGWLKYLFQGFKWGVKKLRKKYQVD